MKLVDMTDNRSFLERFAVNPDRQKRKEHFAKLAHQLRDAMEGLRGLGEDDEFAKYVARLNLVRAGNCRNV